MEVKQNPSTSKRMKKKSDELVQKSTASLPASQPDETISVGAEETSGLEVKQNPSTSKRMKKKSDELVQKSTASLPASQPDETIPVGAEETSGLEVKQNPSTSKRMKKKSDEIVEKSTASVPASQPDETISVRAEDVITPSTRKRPMLILKQLIKHCMMAIGESGCTFNEVIEYLEHNYGLNELEKLEIAEIFFFVSKVVDLFLVRSGGIGLNATYKLNEPKKRKVQKKTEEGESEEKCAAATVKEVVRNYMAAAKVKNKEENKPGPSKMHSRKRPRFILMRLIRDAISDYGKNGASCNQVIHHIEENYGLLNDEEKLEISEIMLGEQGTKFLTRSSGRGLNSKYVLSKKPSEK